MALNVKFYSFAKKENSTAQPSGTAQAEFKNVLIKTGSGIISPTLEISTAENVSSWNYCYISDWSRYYFINEWTYDNGQWIAHCDVDELASWKSYIGSSTQYIARSKTLYDGDVVDTLYPTKTNIDTRISTFGSAPMLGGFSSGTYVVGIINSDSAAQVGGVSYYAMTPSQFGDLKSILLSSMDWMGVAPGDQIMAKTEVNPFQYVVSAKYFPCTVGTAGGASNIKLGWWQPTGINGSYISGLPLKVGINSVTLPSHPDIARGAYLNSEPYTKASLIWGPWGEIPLPSQVIRNYRTISVGIYPDYISGQACLTVTATNSGGSSQLIGNFIAPFAIDIALSQLSMNVSTSTPILDKATETNSSIPVVGIGAGLVGGFIKSLASLFKLGSRSVDAGTAVDRSKDNFIGAAMGLNTLTSAVTGGNGSIATFTAEPYPRYYIAFSRQVDERIDDFGRPYMRSATISSCTGYVKCAHVELTMPCTQQEYQNVIGYMEGGFYYE